MPTLQALEAAATQAVTARDEARDRLDTARRAAERAINNHAVVQSRVVTGAGIQADVDAAAAQRDEKLAALQVVLRELDPDASARSATVLSRPQTRSPT